MTTLICALLILSFANGLWFFLFRSPFVPHLAGLLWGRKFMTNEDLSLELVGRGYDKIFFLWLCSYCQATWTSLVASLPMALLLAPWTTLELWSVVPLSMGWHAAILTPILWIGLAPLFWLLQKPFGQNDLPEVEKPSSSNLALDIVSALPLPVQVEETPLKKGRKLTPEENEVMSFFGLGPCNFSGCEELKASYIARRDEAKSDPNCPPCKQGEIVREYREKIRLIYGYTKEQVPDLLTSPVIIAAPSQPPA